MVLSTNGRVLLEQREGLRLVAYQDIVGVWTIGYGHTGGAGEPYPYPGMTITQAEADQIFASDLTSFVATVNRGCVRTPTQNEFDAYVSLCYNIGEGRWITSTTVRRFNAGDIIGAADAILWWCIPSVLIARREAERRQFLTP